MARQQAEWAGKVNVLQEMYRIFHEINQRKGPVPTLAVEL